MDLVENLVKKGYTVSFHKDGNLYVSMISKKAQHIKLDFIGIDQDFEESLKIAKEKLDKYEESSKENYYGEIVSGLL